jgi:hypothetical protein
VISRSLTIDLIVAALTVQVHIIPGLNSGILTQLTLPLVIQSMDDPLQERDVAETECSRQCSCEEEMCSICG